MILDYTDDNDEEFLATEKCRYRIAAAVLFGLQSLLVAGCYLYYLATIYEGACFGLPVFAGMSLIVITIVQSFLYGFMCCCVHSVGTCLQFLFGILSYTLCDDFPGWMFLLHVGATMATFYYGLQGNRHGVHGSYNLCFN